MNEGLNISKPPWHLDLSIKGAKPIIACIGSFGDYRDSGQTPIIRENFGEHLDNVHNIDYEGVPKDLDKRNFLNGGFNTYVLSTLDSRNKFSERFFNCTGLVVAGIDKENGKNISFLTHQDPKEILKEGSKFSFHLKERLDEIKKRCIPGTIDAVVVGGNYLSVEDYKKRIEYINTSLKEIAHLVEENHQNYLNSIKLLSVKVKETFGFEPVIINGPKKTAGSDNIYFDNKDRGIFFIRQKVNESIRSFTQSNIEEEKKKWE